MGNGNRVEMFIALCAVISSLAAVFIAWDQGRVMRAQQHGAVYPILQIDGYTATSPGTRSLGIRLSNSGVGPALIEDVHLMLDGDVPPDFENAVANLPAGYDLSWTALTGRALAPGDRIEPLRISWFNEQVSAADFQTTAAEWGRFDLVICYCSVFDRCWKTRGLGTSRADAVASCPVGEVDIFEQLGMVSQTAGPQAPSPEAHDTQ